MTSKTNPLNSQINPHLPIPLQLSLFNQLYSKLKNQSEKKGIAGALRESFSCSCNLMSKSPHNLPFTPSNSKIPTRWGKDEADKYYTTFNNMTSSLPVSFHLLHKTPGTG